MRLFLSNLIVAAAGGGSSNYAPSHTPSPSSGGGGGGGGSSGGGFVGGGGSSGSGSSGAGSGAHLSSWWWLLVVAVLLVYGLYRLGKSANANPTPAMRRRSREDRVTRTRLAAAEAAADDADFDPDTVVQAAGDLFMAIQERWTAGDVAALEAMVAPDLMVEWRRRLADFRAKGWTNKCEPLARPKVDYVGLTNREGEDEDRVVVHLEVTMSDYVVDAQGKVITLGGSSSKYTNLNEFWTLKPPGERWTLVSIESDAEGAHQLDAALTASPSADARIAYLATLELAAADAIPAGASISDIAPAVLDEDARAAAMDLSLVDGRFAPHVLEVAVARAAEAWAEAIDGADDGLAALADPAAVTELLYGADLAAGHTRVVVRGARVTDLRIATLDPRATPATMSVALTLHGIRYVEDRDTAAVLSGSKDTAATLRQRWTFSLADDDACPWRLTAIAS
jgi:predicted lipid-binding transport protein (Tim44 family)